MDQRRNNDRFCHFYPAVYELRKSLKTKAFIVEKFLDTAFPPKIRFRQKVLMVISNLRWNYSPLKRRGRPVAGWPFRFRN